MDPGNVMALTTIINMLINNTGIMTFMHFSMPPEIPFDVTKQQKNKMIKKNAVVSGSFSAVSLNNATVSAPENALVTA